MGAEARDRTAFEMSDAMRRAVLELDVVGEAADQRAVGLDSVLVVVHRSDGLGIVGERDAVAIWDRRRSARPGRRLAGRR